MCQCILGQILEMRAGVCSLLSGQEMYICSHHTFTGSSKGPNGVTAQTLTEGLDSLRIVLLV